MMKATCFARQFGVFAKLVVTIGYPVGSPQNGIEDKNRNFILPS
jgi:hypothetical protein